METTDQPATTSIPESKRNAERVVALFADLVTLGASLSLYVAACLSPVAQRFHYPAPPTTDNAVDYLLFGWAWPQYGIWAWYANPLIVFSWLFILASACLHFPLRRMMSTIPDAHRERGAFVCRLVAFVTSNLACVVALSIFSIGDIPALTPELTRGRLQWGIGAHLWIASMAVAAILTGIQVGSQVVAVVLRRLTRLRSREPRPYLG